MPLSSPSAIMDAQITVFSSASVIGPGQVSTAYDVLETTSACCYVITKFSLRNVPSTFGNGRDATYEWGGRGFIKDTGDPKTLIKNAIAFGDKLVTSLTNDDTLQGTIEAIGGITVSYDSEVQVEAGGATWIPIDVTIEMQDLG